MSRDHVNATSIVLFRSNVLNASLSWIWIWDSAHECTAKRLGHLVSQPLIQFHASTTALNSSISPLPSVSGNISRCRAAAP